MTLKKKGKGKKNYYARLHYDDFTFSRHINKLDVSNVRRKGKKRWKLIYGWERLIVCRFIIDLI